MIDLSDQTPFASGGNRLCYRHPQHPDLCVKIMRPGRARELRQNAPWYKKLLDSKRFDDNVREARGYRQKALSNASAGSAVWRHLPHWYGIQATSHGPGAVSQLIADDTGAPAITLEKYLLQFGLSAAIKAALDRFACWLQSSGVLTKNILPHNLVVRTECGRPELYLIDGLGCATLLPLPELFSVAHKHYIQRRILRMWIRVEWELSGRQIRWQEAERQGLRRKQFSLGKKRLR